MYCGSKCFGLKNTDNECENEVVILLVLVIWKSNSTAAISGLCWWTSIASQHGVPDSREGSAAVHGA